MKLLSALMLSLVVGATASVMPVLSTTAYAHDEIEVPMKKMRTAIREAMKAEDIASFKQQFEAFKQSALNASKQSYHGSANEQKTFQDGMKELQAGFAKVDAAIAAGNLEQAKAAFDELNQIKKQYHKKLDV
jgi:soluble cytochrome b562